MRNGIFDLGNSLGATAEVAGTCPDGSQPDISGKCKPTENVPCPDCDIACHNFFASNPGMAAGCPSMCKGESIPFFGGGGAAKFCTSLPAAQQLACIQAYSCPCQRNCARTENTPEGMALCTQACLNGNYPLKCPPGFTPNFATNTCAPIVKPPVAVHKASAAGGSNTVKWLAIGVGVVAAAYLIKKSK